MAGFEPAKFSWSQTRRGNRTPQHLVVFCLRDRTRTCMFTFVTLLLPKQAGNQLPITLSFILAVRVGLEPHQPRAWGHSNRLNYSTNPLILLYNYYKRYYTYLPISFCGPYRIRTGTTHRDRVVL